MKTAIRKLRKDNGGNAALSLLVSMPFLFTLILFMLTVVQIGLARQAIEYAAYSAARAAVVTDNREEAEKQAHAIGVDILQAGTIGVYMDSIEVIITPMSGVFDAGGNIFESIRWEKGTIIKCEVIVTLDTIMLGGITLSSNITMMVERPAPDYWG